MASRASGVTTGQRPGGKDDRRGATRFRVVNNGGHRSPDPRAEIPVLGFTDYWYPLIGAAKVPRRRPVLVKLLGRELCVFRGEHGIAALDDFCVHRGARLSEGRCQFKGTVSCPYHGWTYDEEGTCVAVLTESPRSPIAGRASVRRYPVREIKGILFAWMGEGEPTDPATDLPPELFDPTSFVLHDQTVWHANWRPALENFNDNHTPYAHRNSLSLLMIPWLKVSYRGARPIITGGGLRLSHYDDGTVRDRPYREWFEGVKGNWPKHEFRRRTAPLFRTRVLKWLKPLGTRSATFSENEGALAEDQEWATGPHMPGMMRLSRGDNVYTRWCVPIDEGSTRQFYLTAFWPESRAARLFLRWFRYPITFRFINHRNFGMQDGRILARLRYDRPERFSAFDIETVGWRRFAILAARHGGRHDRIPPDVIAEFNEGRGQAVAAAEEPDESEDGVPGPRS